ncbi:MAG: ribbon-helix-helix domain-containing protein [Telmatospirillum sp.]|nr:ribbon-helix-helix domain-containing protein [Telmatospirillum sp.]
MSLSQSLRAARTKNGHGNTDSGLDYTRSAHRNGAGVRSLDGLAGRGPQGKVLVRGRGRKSAYECIEIAPRSVWIGGRRTSIRLEPEFWEALSCIAKREATDPPGVLLEIERIHGRSRFASKVRVAILNYFRL